MDVLRQVFSVALVFALLGCAFIALKRGSLGRVRFTPRHSGGIRQLESVDRLALTPQHALHLVRVAGRDVLIATHPQGCALLSEPVLTNRQGANA